jgi:ABC-2 type transport system ATP-binding protein
MSSSSSFALRAAALPQPSVVLQGLHLRYERQPVLEGLDWQLLPGQVVGLLGRNGAGKTSLLESLLGLRDLHAGSVQLFGQPVALLDDAARARIGYVPQHSDLFEWLTADELLRYFRSFYPRWNEARVNALMARWAVPRDKTIGLLSGGEQQRLAIVRALAHEPELLVLDEPVASLDPAGRRDFLRELVEQVLDRGTTVVFSTHILSDLERVAFNVAFMSRGRIVLQAPLDDLLDSVRRVAGRAPDVERWLRSSGAEALARQAVADGSLEVLARSRSAAAAGAGLSVQPVSLEDLFMALT